VPLFLLIDVALFYGTYLNTVALAVDLEPFTKAGLLVTDIAFSAADIGAAFLEVSYAHWVVTGEPINSWDDVTNWQAAP